MSEREHHMHVHPVSMIDILRKGRVDLHTALAELVDNANGARARQVKIDIERDVIRVRDNGHGCADLSRLIDIKATGDDGERTGRYGWGATYVTCNLGELLAVRSVCAGMHRALVANYAEMMRAKSDVYVISDPVPVQGAAFFEVEMTGLRRRRAYSQLHVQGVRDDFARRYFDALNSGLRIIVNDILVRPLKLPKVEQAIDFEDEFNGKKYRVRHFGILLDGQGDLLNKWKGKGWHAICHGRTLNERGELYGFGDHGAARAFGLIELVEGRGSTWGLRPDKTDFEEFEALCESIHPRVAQMLEAAANRQDRLDIAQSLEGAEALFSAAVGATARGRAKRNQANKTQAGTVTPIGTGRKTNKADRITADATGLIEVGGKNVEFSFESGLGDEVCVISQPGRKKWLVQFNEDYMLFQTKVRHDHLALNLIAAHAIASRAIELPTGAIELISAEQQQDLVGNEKDRARILHKLIDQMVTVWMKREGIAITAQAS